ncbi:MAG TPA: NAD(P)-binding domain-containing protein, partial [Aggregatilineales bacterium]|nr:NAD(P)-binding domain-containing protein [Aggregatilineales bacterium]
MLYDQKVTFIGSGAMGEAMIKGLLHQELIPANYITASDPHIERGDELAKRYGLVFTTDNL